jgi:ABC-2 type transport system ATP-binding protein
LESVIVTQNLTKKYNEVCAINDLNLNVGAGEIFGFLGPNGAGKTTTIRVLTTLVKASSGSVNLCGFDVDKQSGEVKKVIGVVQQHLTLDLDLNLRENLELHGRLHHLSKKERDNRIGELLDYVGLTKQSARMITELSGGMKKAAMIARALMHKPKLLFLDEPTVGLDVQTRRRMWDLIRRLNSNGTTIFLTTHYIEEAEALCHRVGIVNNGELIAIGTPQELRKKIGLTAVETSEEGKFTNYKYFENQESAKKFVETLSSETKRIVIRDSNLEDVFVELTGSKVGEAEI